MKQTIRFASQPEPRSFNTIGMVDNSSRDAGIDNGVPASACSVDRMLERASRFPALLIVDKRNYIDPRLAGGTIPFMRRYTTNWP